MTFLAVEWVWEVDSCLFAASLRPGGNPDLPCLELTQVQSPAQPDSDKEDQRLGSQFKESGKIRNTAATRTIEWAFHIGSSKPQFFVASLRDHTKFA